MTKTSRILKTHQALSFFTGLLSIILAFVAKGFDEILSQNLLGYSVFCGVIFVLVTAGLLIIRQK